MTFIHLHFFLLQITLLNFYFSRNYTFYISNAHRNYVVKYFSKETTISDYAILELQRSPLFLLLFCYIIIF